MHHSLLQRSDYLRDLAEIKLTEVFREHMQNVFCERTHFKCFLLENKVMLSPVSFCDVDFIEHLYIYSFSHLWSLSLLKAKQMLK